MLRAWILLWLFAATVLIVSAAQSTPPIPLSKISLPEPAYVGTPIWMQVESPTSSFEAADALSDSFAKSRKRLKQSFEHTCAFYGARDSPLRFFPRYVEPTRLRFIPRKTGFFAGHLLCARSAVTARPTCGLRSFLRPVLPEWRHIPCAVRSDPAD
jgi:hypothetical protein